MMKRRCPSRVIAAVILAPLVAASISAGAVSWGSPARSAGDVAANATSLSTVNGHYLYVLPDDTTIYVYDMDHAHALVETIALPSNVVYVRGFAADPVSRALYIGYHGTGSGGWLLKLDLLTNQVIYNVALPLSVDSFAVTPDGKTIYMPDGDDQPNGIWHIMDAATGAVTGAIDTGGHNPHNTIVTLSGKSVLMGNRLSNYLVMADTATNQSRSWTFTYTGLVGSVGTTGNSATFARSSVVNGPPREWIIPGPSPVQFVYCPAWPTGIKNPDA